jgi:hypothetical protein
VTRVLAVLLVLAMGAPAAALADKSQSASLGGFVCRQAQNPLNRVVSVTATIRPVTGTARMALRFALMQRLPGQRPHQVHGGDLGRWKTLSPGPWAITKPVANLAGPAVYRFRVSFRWFGASGLVIGSQTLFSRGCYQPQSPPAAG